MFFCNFIWRSIVGAGVVHKVVEPATGDLLNLLFQSKYGILFVNVQLKSCSIFMRLVKFS